MLSYGRLTIDFRIAVFTQTRWLFSYGVTFLPDACGQMLLYSVCWSLRSVSYLTSFKSARKCINNTTFLSGRNAIFVAAGSITLVL